MEFVYLMPHTHGGYIASVHVSKCLDIAKEAREQMCQAISFLAESVEQIQRHVIDSEMLDQGYNYDSLHIHNCAIEALKGLGNKKEDSKMPNTVEEKSEAKVKVGQVWQDKRSEKYFEVEAANGTIQLGPLPTGDYKTVSEKNLKIHYKLVSVDVGKFQKEHPELKAPEPTPQVLTTEAKENEPSRESTIHPVPKPSQSKKGGKASKDDQSHVITVKPTPKKKGVQEIVLVPPKGTPPQEAGEVKPPEVPGATESKRPTPAKPKQVLLKDGTRISTHDFMRNVAKVEPDKPESNGTSKIWHWLQTSEKGQEIMKKTGATIVENDGSPAAMAATRKSKKEATWLDKVAGKGDK